MKTTPDLPSRSFALAPMSGVFRILTGLLLLLPVGFIGIGLNVANPEGRVLLWTGAFVAVLYLGIWLYALPRRFDVNGAELILVWPWRSQRVPRSDLRAARILGRDEFKEEFGWAAHVGAGGMWGTFGRLWTSRRGCLDLYVTRSDSWVLLERISGRPLLLTPEQPEDFVAVLIC